jgi:hypothetical protein
MPAGAEASPFSAEIHPRRSMTRSTPLDANMLTIRSTRRRDFSLPKTFPTVSILRNSTGCTMSAYRLTDGLVAIPSSTSITLSILSSPSLAGAARGPSVDELSEKPVAINAPEKPKANTSDLVGVADSVGACLGGGKLPQPVPLGTFPPEHRDLLRGGLNRSLSV